MGRSSRAGGRAAAGSMLALTVGITAGAGFWFGVFWAVYH